MCKHLAERTETIGDCNSLLIVGPGVPDCVRFLNLDDPNIPLDPDVTG